MYLTQKSAFVLLTHYILNAKFTNHVIQVLDKRVGKTLGVMGWGWNWRIMGTSGLLNFFSKNEENN